MAKKWKIRLSGTGGQGVIRGAMLLAEAALLDGRNATQSQVYGPESRGGSTRAEVNISDERILFPKVVCPNLLLCLSLEAYKKYSSQIEAGGYLVVDGELGVGDEHPGVKVYRAPIILIAREQVGNEMSANVVALGVLNGIFDLVSDAAIEEALNNGFKGDVLEANLKAYKLGRAAGEAVK
jgi:2-oxoglutarate ferredoxin oxidoreductase subunit gamma